MALFSRLKRSKKAAKMHKQIASEKMGAEDLPKQPYKHVPTHAFFDALNGGPSNWKQVDKMKIREQRAERRSLMSSDPSLSSRQDDRTHAQSLI